MCGFTNDNQYLKKKYSELDYIIAMFFVLSHTSNKAKHVHPISAVRYMHGIDDSFNAEWLCTSA